MKFFVGLALAVLVCEATAQTSFRQMKAHYNQGIVEEVLERLVSGGDGDALEEHYSEYFVQHTPNLPNGRDALHNLFVVNRPVNFTYEVGGIWSEGDFVVVFGRISNHGFGDLPVVAADIFKLINGKIVEHWDVIQEETLAEDTVTGTPVWPVSLDDIPRQSAEVEEANRRLVIEANERLFGLSDITALDDYWVGEDYIQHNPVVANGVTGLVAFVGPREPGYFSLEIGWAVAHGDYVLIHSRGPFENTIAVDIFRVEDGRLAEHWDVLQAEVSPLVSANGNRMFPITN